MTNADADALLVDTNVLVYAANPNAPLHSVALATLVRHRTAGRQMWISTQVIREFLVVMCNPSLTTPALHPEQAAVSVRYLLRRFCVAEDTHQVSRALSRLLTLLPAGARRIHDGNIVATCQAHGISSILTHNPATSRRSRASSTSNRWSGLCPSNAAGNRDGRARPTFEVFRLGAKLKGQAKDGRGQGANQFRAVPDKILTFSRKQR